MTQKLKRPKFKTFMFSIFFLITLPFINPQALAKDLKKSSPQLDYPLNRLAYPDDNVSMDVPNSLHDPRLNRLLNIRSSQKSLFVLIEAKDQNSVTSTLSHLQKIQGLKVDAISKTLVRVLISPDQLQALTKLPSVRKIRLGSHAMVRPIQPTRSRISDTFGFGPTVSESVELTNAHLVQEEVERLKSLPSNKNLKSPRVKIAVIDLGFQGLQAAFNRNELLKNRVHQANLPGAQDDNLETVTPHGVAVAEQIADMAPDAEIHLIKVVDELDMENAAVYLKQNNIHIANHSVTWLNASYYDGTGPINKIVDDSTKNDKVLWTVSAGNFGNSHWRGKWISEESRYLQFEGSSVSHGLEITSLPGTVVSVYFNWDQYGKSFTDLDLFIEDNAGNIVARSEAPQSGLQIPAEVLSFEYVRNKAPYIVRALKFSDPKNKANDLDLSLFTFGGEFPEANAKKSSLADPASARNALTVGAINQGDWLTFSNNEVTDYSSEGPTTDGREKPNLVAPDGTQCSVYGRCLGTSFSAPTVGGAAALLVAYNQWLGQNPPSGLALKKKMESLVSKRQNVEPPNYVVGKGRLDLEEAIEIPNHPPVVANKVILKTDKNKSIDIDLRTLSSDPDQDPLTFEITLNPSFGQFSMVNDHTVRYSPNRGFTGDDRFHFLAYDGKAYSDHKGLVIIQVVTTKPDPNSNPKKIKAQSNFERPLNENTQPWLGPWSVSSQRAIKRVPYRDHVPTGSRGNYHLQINGRGKAAVRGIPLPNNGKRLRLDLQWRTRLFQTSDRAEILVILMDQFNKSHSVMVKSLTHRDPTERYQKLSKNVNIKGMTRAYLMIRTSASNSKRSKVFIDDISLEAK